MGVAAFPLVLGGVGALAGAATAGVTTAATAASAVATTGSTAVSLGAGAAGSTASLAASSASIAPSLATGAGAGFAGFGPSAGGAAASTASSAGGGAGGGFLDGLLESVGGKEGLGSLLKLSGTAGQFFQGQANAEGTASLAAFNAKQLRRAEHDALDRGRERVLELGRDARAARGSLRASLAARGVDTGGELAQQLDSDLEGFQARQRQRIEVNAQREAYGFRLQRRIGKFEADAAAASSSSAGIGQLLSLGAGVLGSPALEGSLFDFDLFAS